MDDESPEVVGKIDGVTGLPWSTMIHGETAQLALASDLHVVDIHLAGLSAVMDAHGAQAFVSVLRAISRNTTALLDERDRLSRHTGDRLLLVTARPPEHVSALVQQIVAGITAAAVQVDGEWTPRVHVGLARLPRATDHTEAMTRLDAAILSAELAAAPMLSAAPNAAPIGTIHAAAGPRDHRAVLRSLQVDLSGLVATAIVEVVFGRRRAVARSVGRNVEERRLFLIGEATSRAVTDLLPAGYGVVIHDVQLLQPGLPEQGRGILSSVLFLSPESEQYLFGVAAAGSDPRMAAARASLSAVNRRIEPLLAAAGA